MTSENTLPDGTPEEVLLPYDDNRFESDPVEVLPDDPGLPVGWEAGSPDPSQVQDIARLTAMIEDIGA